MHIVGWDEELTNYCNFHDLDSDSAEANAGFYRALGEIEAAMDTLKAHSEAMGYAPVQTPYDGLNMRPVHSCSANDSRH
mgnify:CR=1 FL=1